MVRRILVGILLTINLATYSQQKQIISLSFDIKMATEGAYDYNNDPVFNGRFSWVTSFPSGNEYGIFVEYAKLDPKYFDYGAMYNRKLFGRELEGLIGAEVSLIVREFEGYETQKAYIAYGANGTLRYHFFDFFSLDMRVNAKYRTDLVKYYNDSDPMRYSVLLGMSVYF